MSKTFCILLVFLSAFVINVSAQGEKCNVELKFFEYNLENKKITVSDLDLIIINLKDKSEQKVKTETDSFLLVDQKNGNYKIKLQKSGFKKREKEFELDCKFADKSNNFIVQVYLTAKNNREIKDESPDSAGGNQFTGGKDNQSSTDTEEASSNVANKTNDDGKKDDLNIASVTVAVEIDEDGNVISAVPVEGISEFFEKTVKAVRLTKFAPTFLSGFPVSVTGNIVYNYKK